MLFGLAFLRRFKFMTRPEKIIYLKQKPTLTVVPKSLVRAILMLKMIYLFKTKKSC